MNARLRNVDAIMPPATAVPTECRASRPAPLANDERHDAEDEGERRHQNRPQPDARGFDRRVGDRHAARAQLLGELDDQNAVLRRQADQHHQADLAVDVVDQAAAPLRRAARRESRAAPTAG